VSPDIELISAFIYELGIQGFWGSVTLKLQDGKIIHITKEESLKPSQLGPEHRRNLERSKL